MTAILELWDGAGSLMETWDLEDALIQSINFGDLSYSSADETELEVSLRYSEVTYTTACRDAWLKSPVCPQSDDYFAGAGAATPAEAPPPGPPETPDTGTAVPFVGGFFGRLLPSSALSSAINKPSSSCCRNCLKFISVFRQAQQKGPAFTGPFCFGQRLLVNGV